ncbi:Cytochrome P450 monooxygenase COX2, partial [Fusarium oxysporum f. sp. albedinis]
MTKWEKSLLCRPSEWKEERKKYLPTLRRAGTPVIDGTGVFLPSRPLSLHP